MCRAVPKPLERVRMNAIQSPIPQGYVKVERKLHLLYKHPTPGDAPGLVWRVREIYDTDSFFDHIARNVRIQNGCHSIYEPFDDPHVNYHQVGCEGILHSKDGQILICPESPLITERGIAGITLRVRFNTDHIRNPRELPWRIGRIIEGRYSERLAASFEIDGVCYTTSDILHKVGEKWHIGCRGSVTFRGTHARITSYE
jgi:hypothetical protein